MNPPKLDPGSDFETFLRSTERGGGLLKFVEAFQPEIATLAEEFSLQGEDMLQQRALALIINLVKLALTVNERPPNALGDAHSMQALFKAIGEELQKSVPPGGDEIMGFLAKFGIDVMLRIRHRLAPSSADLARSVDGFDALSNALRAFSPEGRVNTSDVYDRLAEVGEWSNDELSEHMKGSLVMWTLELLATAHDLMRDTVIANIKDVPESARDRLTSAVRERLRTIISRSRAEDASSGLLPLDAAFLGELASLGDHGKAHAEDIAPTIPDRIAKGESPWYGWLPDGKHAKPPRRLRVLASAVWLDVVQPELRRERLRHERNHEALAMPIHLEVVKLHSRAGTHNQNSRQLLFDDGSAISFDRCPLLDADTLAVVARGIQLLGSVDAHRLLRWEVSTGYARWLNGIEPRHVIDVEKGYPELAEQLGIRDKGAPQRLRAILMAQRTCAFPLPGPEEGTGNLIILSEWKGSGRRPSRIRIELGTMLMPDYTRELAKTLGSRELERCKKLVPLVGLPPFIGRERDHGAQATLSMLVTRELRWNAAELVREGGVRIGLERWAALAAEARIPRSQVSQQLRPLLDRWTRDGDDGPAFLKTEGKDERYTLGDSHDAARRFLIEGGKRELHGSAGGKRRARAHQARLTKASNAHKR